MIWISALIQISLASSEVISHCGWNTLTLGQQDLLKQQNVLLLKETEPNDPQAIFPKVKIYQLLENASSEELMAVFSETKLQHHYTQGMKPIKVLKETSPLATQAKITLEIKGIGQQVYISENLLSKKDEAFFLTSKLIKTLKGKVKRNDVQLCLEPLGSLTLRRVTLYLNPGLLFAQFLVEKYLSEIRALNQSSWNFFKNLQTQNPEKLSTLVQILRNKFTLQPEPRRTNNLERHSLP